MGKNGTTWRGRVRERLIKVGMPHHYSRHNCVRVVLKNLLTCTMLTNFLRAPLPSLEEQF